jgi:glycosyltransferase involved in cell wall biosynthesis
VMSSDKYARLCIVGPLLGKNANWVISQGESLAESLSGQGYQVKLTSNITNRYFRNINHIFTLFTNRHEIDIIIVMVFSGRAFITADLISRSAKILKKPLILWLHGGKLPEFSQRYPKWVRKVFRRADRIISPSGYLARIFRKSNFTIHEIPNLLDIKKYSFQLRKNLRPRLLWMRTFHEIYNPIMAIDVIEQLSHSYPDATLTMAGQDKGLLNSVKRAARIKGLSDRVDFVGFLDMAGKQREFARNDIYLNTSRVDNMPVSLIEAAAFGLPIISTEVGGIPDLLDRGKTALIAEDGDVVGMTNCVRRLLSAPRLAASLSLNGRQLAESCGWENVREKWENLFRQVIN